MSTRDHEQARTTEPGGAALQALLDTLAKILADPNPACIDMAESFVAASSNIRFRELGETMIAVRMIREKHVARPSPADPGVRKPSWSRSV